MGESICISEFPVSDAMSSACTDSVSSVFSSASGSSSSVVSTVVIWSSVSGGVDSTMGVIVRVMGFEDRPMRVGTIGC